MIFVALTAVPLALAFGAMFVTLKIVARIDRRTIPYDGPSAPEFK